MPSSKMTRLPFRNDTVLGVCEAIGQDLGFHANWLRIAFALAFYWSPSAVIGTYLALGAIVLASRLIFPDRVVDEPAQIAPVAIAAPDEEEVRLAA